MIIPEFFCAVFVRYTNTDGHPCENVMGYLISATPTQDDADDLSVDLAAAYKDQLDTGSTYDGLHILVGQAVGDPLVVDSVANAGAGTVGGAKMPPNVQGLISKRTGVSGRKNRGRVYIADMLVSQVNSQGGIASAGVTKLGTIAAALFDANSSAAVFGAPHILHTGPEAPTEITSMFAEATVATQRRRLER